MTNKQYITLTQKYQEQQERLADLEIAFARLCLQVNGSYSAPYTIPRPPKELS